MHVILASILVIYFITVFVVLAAPDFSSYPSGKNFQQPAILQDRSTTTETDSDSDCHALKNVMNHLQSLVQQQLDQTLIYRATTASDDDQKTAENVATSRLKKNVLSNADHHLYVYNIQEIRKLLHRLAEFEKERDKMDLESLISGKLLSNILMPKGECPLADDGHRKLFCPTPDAEGQWQCIDDNELCDGMKNCPHGEDELTIQCFFYRAMESHIRVLTQSYISFHG